MIRQGFYPLQFDLSYDFIRPENSKIIADMISQPSGLHFYQGIANGESEVINYVSQIFTNLPKALEDPSRAYNFTNIRSLFIDRRIDPTEIPSIYDIINKIILFFPLNVSIRGTTSAYSYGIYNPEDLATWLNVLGAIETFYNKIATEDDLEKVFPTFNEEAVQRVIRNFGTGNITLMDAIRTTPYFSILFQGLKTISTTISGVVDGFYEVKLYRINI